MMHPYLIRKVSRGPVGAAYDGPSVQLAGVETTHQFLGPAKVAALKLLEVNPVGWIVCREGRTIWSTNERTS